MQPNQYKIKAKVWLHPGDGGAWHFVTVPPKESANIKSLFHGLSRGWGSLPVKAAIGQTTWQTSIFPDKKRGAYLLPIKASVRKAENFGNGDTISLSIEIMI